LLIQARSRKINVKLRGALAAMDDKTAMAKSIICLLGHLTLLWCPTTV
jgi:hypothetical protein